MAKRIWEILVLRGNRYAVAARLRSLQRAAMICNQLERRGVLTALHRIEATPSLPSRGSGGGQRHRRRAVVANSESR